jgi:hypothetical protein
MASALAKFPTANVAAVATSLRAVATLGMFTGPRAGEKRPASPIAGSAKRSKLADADDMWQHPELMAKLLDALAPFEAKAERERAEAARTEKAGPPPSERLAAPDPTFVPNVYETLTEEQKMALATIFATFVKHDVLPSTVLDEIAQATVNEPPQVKVELLRFEAHKTNGPVSSHSGIFSAGEAGVLAATEFLNRVAKEEAKKMAEPGDYSSADDDEGSGQGNGAVDEAEIDFVSGTFDGDRVGFVAAVVTALDTKAADVWFSWPVPTKEFLEPVNTPGRVTDQNSRFAIDLYVQLDGTLGKTVGYIWKKSPEESRGIVNEVVAARVHDRTTGKSLLYKSNEAFRAFIGGQF